MGNKHSILNPEPQNHKILDYGYCKVWKSLLTEEQQFQEYNVSIESLQNLYSFQRMWQFRNQYQNFVKIVYFTHSDLKNLCSTQQEGCIISQRIPYRLSQFINIFYEEIITILTIALKSFEILYKCFKYPFLIRSTMIGFNNKFQVKIWCHTDLSESQPQNPYCQNLQQMILSIINSIEIRGNYPYNYPKFSQYIFGRNNVINNFQQIEETLQNYKIKYKIKTNNKISKLNKFLKQVQGWQQLTFRSSINSTYQENYNNGYSTTINKPIVSQLSEKQYNGDYKQNQSFVVQKSLPPTYIKTFTNNHNCQNNLPPLPRNSQRILNSKPLKNDIIQNQHNQQMYQNKVQEREYLRYSSSLQKLNSSERLQSNINLNKNVYGLYGNSIQPSFMIKNSLSSTSFSGKCNTNIHNNNNTNNPYKINFRYL